MAGILCAESTTKDALSMGTLNIDSNTKFTFTKKAKLSKAWSSLLQTMAKDFAENPQLLSIELKETEKYLYLRIQQLSKSLKLSEESLADLLLILALDSSIPRTKTPGPVVTRVLPELNISEIIQSKDLKMELAPNPSLLGLIRGKHPENQSSYVISMKSRALALSAAKLLVELNTTKAWRNLGLLYFTSKSDLRDSPEFRDMGYNSFFYDLSRIAMTNNRLDRGGQKHTGLHQAREILQEIIDQFGLPIEKGIEQIDDILLDIRAANMGA